jgi:hypothetical protein
MKTLIAASALGLVSLGITALFHPPTDRAARMAELQEDAIRDAFAKQGIRTNPAELRSIRANVQIAVNEARQHGLGNSKVDFACVEIAQDLGLDTSAGSQSLAHVRSAIGQLMNGSLPMQAPLSWDRYFDQTVSLGDQQDFMGLMAGSQFHPVKISWEDIGRHEGSVWGDRISDVGIWVRKREDDADSAQLALSVRRDSNFRDKVLMVPSDKIKVHVNEGGRSVERTLPERLRELGLASQNRDRNVIVSNQFAVVPVPARTMQGAWKPDAPPRAAFNFSIFPYGSTNFVITDVIEGSSEAIVGPGTHQMLYANIDGQKAPFTASRAEDRQDLLRLESELKARGMDVDVQRYYLIQIPLKRDAQGIQLSNMGTPPLSRGFGNGGVLCTEAVPPPPPQMSYKADVSATKGVDKSAEAGLSKVAIGHGEAEGRYFIGGGFRGQRAEEPIRVTVVYFVTPVGKVGPRDMAAFSKAFKQWDQQAIWGGSFVTKEQGM